MFVLQIMCLIVFGLTMGRALAYWSWGDDDLTRTFLGAAALFMALAILAQHWKTP